MERGFKVEIRKTCKECGELLHKRQRTYCSKKCRLKATNKKHSKMQVQWERNKRDKEASIPSKNKLQCQICGKWYTQVGSHVVQVHNMTAREYKEQYGFDVKKGQLPEDYRKLKKQRVFENKTVENLKEGEKYRFKKNQKGIGTYKRSEETLERLKVLYKYTNKYKNFISKKGERST